MSTKDFKEGMVAGAKPFGDKLEQLATVSESAVSDIKEGLEGVTNTVSIVSKAVVNVVDDLSTQEKKRIYDLDEATDISALNGDEKEFVVAVLTEFANIVSETSDLQKKYLLSICSATNISAPQTSLNLSCIENIESMKTQKILLRHIMEFFFIAEENYEFLDTYEEIFSYFSVNQRGIADIKETIDRVFNAMGVEGIANRYTFSVGYEEIDFDVPAEENIDNSPVEYVPNESEFEHILLNDVLHINEGETSVYKYKKLDISAIVNVDGVLNFENCIISLFDEDTPAHFTVKGELNFSNCQIVGKIDNKKHIDDEENAIGKGILNGAVSSKLSFENCIINNVGHFISSTGTLWMNSCSIYNPGIRFIAIETAKASTISNTSLDFENDFDIDTDEKFTHSIIFATSSQNSSEDAGLSVTNCKFEVVDEANLSDVLPISSSKSACNISNSEFYNFAKVKATVFVSSILRSSFEKCRGIIADKISDCHMSESSFICARKDATIENCDFNDCKTIALPGNGIMRDCRILNSRGRIIEAANSYISDCIFSNIRKWNKGTPTNIIWGKESERNYPIYIQNAKISSCVFDGIELRDNAFLIVGEQLANIKTPFSIEKCVFRNCYTDRSDKKIIIGREHYGIITSKTKNLDPISACVGLDQVKSGLLEADVPVTDSPKNYGIVAGAVVGAVLTGGIGAIVGSIVGGTMGKVIDK